MKLTNVAAKMLQEAKFICSIEVCSHDGKT